jgi:hypothetical protein
MSSQDFDPQPVLELSTRILDNSPGDADYSQLATLLRADSRNRDVWISQVTIDELLRTHHRERHAEDLHREIYEMAAQVARRRRRRRFLIAAVISSGSLAVLLCCGVLPALLLPAVQASREAARRASSMSNLKQIGLGLHNFHATHDAFPAAYSIDTEGRPLLSWRVYLLPYLEQEELYSKFRLDEPWDSPHNIRLLPAMPTVYRSPLSDRSDETVYVAIPIADGAICRPRAPTDGVKPPLGVSIREIIDGTSNTVMVVEVDPRDAVPWTKPVDYPAAESALLANYSERSGHASNGGMQSSESRVNCVLALFADGAVYAPGEGIPRSLVTKSGGEASFP